MFNRNPFLLVAGAAIFTLGASVASAQDSTRAHPRSQRRIPVQKEAAGEVVPPRVDTVTIYHTDTLRMEGRVDTVTRTHTVTHYDTVTQTITVLPRMIAGWHFGLAGGTSLPYGGLRTVNNPAATGQLQVGYQGLNNILGGRFDVMYNQFSDSPQFAELGGNPSVWNFNLDARVNLPIFNHFLGSASRFTPYLLGGGSLISFKNLRLQLNTDNITNVQAVTVNNQTALIVNNNNGFGDVGPVDLGLMNDTYHTDWGWNAGGGIAMHFGSKEVFIESRVIEFRRSNDDNLGLGFKTARQIPIVFGLNFY